MNWYLLIIPHTRGVCQRHQGRPAEEKVRRRFSLLLWLPNDHCSLSGHCRVWIYNLYIYIYESQILSKAPGALTFACCLMKMLRFGLEYNPIRPLYTLRRIEKVKVSAGRPWKPLNLVEQNILSTCKTIFSSRRCNLEVTIYGSSFFIILLQQSTEEQNRTIAPSLRRRLAEISGSSLPEWTAGTSLSTAPPKHSSTARWHFTNRE